MLSRPRLLFTGINATSHNCKLIRDQHQLITNMCLTAPDRGSGVDAILMLIFDSSILVLVVQSINHPHTVRNRTAAFLIIGSANQSVRNVTRTSPLFQNQPLVFTIRYSSLKTIPLVLYDIVLIQTLARAKPSTCKSTCLSFFVGRHSLCKPSSQFFISYLVIFNL